MKRSIILKRACVNFILFDSKLVCKQESSRNLWESLIENIFWFSILVKYEIMISFNFLRSYIKENFLNFLFRILSWFRMPGQRDLWGMSLTFYEKRYEYFIGQFVCSWGWSFWEKRPQISHIKYLSLVNWNKWNLIYEAI